MKVNILQLLDGARNAEGLTVIIDVFRAFSTACYAFDKGVKKIIPVGQIEKAYQLKKKNPEYILVGERNEKMPEGFEFGNSPALLTRAIITGKTLVHTTSSGTQGIVSAKNADEIITGSFVNAAAIINYIRMKNPQKVSLVCMGYACQYPTDEDTFCAEYIKNELESVPTNFQQIIDIIRNGTGARFFDKEKQNWSPKEDFYMCLDLNRFNFVLRAEQENGNFHLRKIDVKNLYNEIQL
jgi:2-phosphosulfolactate phosphatase